MLISSKAVELLQFRIQQEEFSSRLYKQISLWLEDKGYMNFSKLYERYAKEELVHADWAAEFLLSFNKKPELRKLEAPVSEFKGIREISELTLEHETEITTQCKELYKFAVENNEPSLIPLALKYISEQTEELKKAYDLINILDTFGTDKASLLVLDLNLSNYFEL